MLGDQDQGLEGPPEPTIASFAGTGNPFSLGEICLGERVVDIGSGAGMDNIEFREGYAETLPVPDGWADLVISNGVLNLVPDKTAALQEMARVLKPNGRLQIGDILVQKAVPDSAKRKIDLWTG